MKRKSSKALLKRVSKVTNLIFQDTIREVLQLNNESEDELYSAIDLIRHAKDYVGFFPKEEISEMLRAKEQIDELYLKRLLGLTTRQLEEIMIAHNEGQIPRMAKTVEAIISELARRSFFGDATESDDRYNNGDVDGHKVKSTDNRKKLTAKRRKTIENRRND